MPKNIIEKIWDAHIVMQEEGAPVIFAIDKMLVHEITSAQPCDELRKRGLTVRYPERFLATPDHSVPTAHDRHIIIRDADAKKQIEALRKNCQEFNIKIYDFGSNKQGVTHVISPELGFVHPGDTIACGDSHTSTHGAFGALAFGIGTTEVTHVLATNCLLQHKPKTMLVKFMGMPPKNITSKDIILKLIAEIGIGGANGYIIEYSGEAIKAMSMEARMTVSNMSIECGARAGIIAPDEKTYAYLKDKEYVPANDAWDRAKAKWESLQSDLDCEYDKITEVDISKLKPMISWGINPQQSIQFDEKIPTLDEIEESQRQIAQDAYNYTGISGGEKILGQKIQWAFIGSCTNGRIEDLRQAAAILKGKKVAESVTLFIVPGSEQVRNLAQKEGIEDIFIQAGGQFRMPGCSICMAVNEDRVPSGVHCISTSNRNFMGRQGPGSITHIASPETVALSAIAGEIAVKELC